MKPRNAPFQTPLGVRVVMSAGIPGGLALIHFAAREAGKGLKGTPQTMVGWDKAQGDRESTPEARGYQTKAFLWEEPEVLRALRTPEFLE